MREMFVVCSECSERHTAKEVVSTNIEEGPNGEDILTFECPVTKNETKSIVYRGR